MKQISKVLGKWKNSLFTLSLMIFIMIGSSCFSDEYGNGKKFDFHTSEAIKAGLANNDEAQLNHLLSAKKIADEMGWNDLSVTTNISIAQYYSVKHDFQKTESILFEAKDICLKKSCSSSSRTLINDNLMFLYTYSLKDAVKAASIASEIKSNK